MTAEKYMCVGRVTRPHGLAGYVEVLSLTDNPDRFKIGNSFRLNPPLPGHESVTISGKKQKKDRQLLRFERFEDRDAVEQLLDRELVVPEEEASKPRDSFWIHEIVGCRVVTTDGAELGTVTEVLRTGGSDIYVVAGAKEYYIPAVRDVVKEIDTERGHIEVDPPPGLLEL